MSFGSAPTPSTGLQPVQSKACPDCSGTGRCTKCNGTQLEVMAPGCIASCTCRNGNCSRCHGLGQVPA